MATVEQSEYWSIDFYHPHFGWLGHEKGDDPKWLLSDRRSAELEAKHAARRDGYKRRVRQVTTL